MTQENLRSCLRTLSSKIPTASMTVIKNILVDADDSLAERIVLEKYDEPLIVLLLSVFTGYLGVDRFYLGDVGLGVCKLLFGWLTLGIWAFADIFLCFKKVKNRNLNKVMKIFAEYNKEKSNSKVNPF